MSKPCKCTPPKTTKRSIEKEVAAKDFRLNKHYRTRSLPNKKKHHVAGINIPVDKPTELIQCGTVNTVFPPNVPAPYIYTWE
jgi:hypothetical protein